MATRLLLGLFLSAAFVSLGCSSTEQSELSMGDRAPGFTLRSANGSEVSLSDFAGKQDVLLYFNMGYG